MCLPSVGVLHVCIAVGVPGDWVLRGSAFFVRHPLVFGVAVLVCFTALLAGYCAVGISFSGVAFCEDVKKLEELSGGCLERVSERGGG